MTSNIQLQLALKVALVRENTGWPNATQGTNTLAANLKGVDLDVWDNAYVANVPVAGGATVTIDLRNFTTLIFEPAVAFDRVFGIAVVTELADPAETAASLVIGPGASNGLVWFFGSAGDTITLQAGDVFLKMAPATDVTGFTVDGTHKTLDLTNPGTDDLVATVIILGGT